MSYLRARNFRTLSLDFGVAKGVIEPGYTKGDIEPGYTKLAFAPVDPQLLPPLTHLILRYKPCLDPTERSGSYLS